AHTPAGDAVGERARGAARCSRRAPRWFSHAGRPAPHALDLPARRNLGGPPRPREDRRAQRLVSGAARSDSGVRAPGRVMPYVMVDIEADGPIPGDYSMISLGAIVVEPRLDRGYGMQLKPISDKWVPEALGVGGYTRE